MREFHLHNPNEETEIKIIAKEYALKAAELNPRGIISILAAANSLFTVGLFNEALVNYEKALAVAPHPPANVKLNYSMALLYLENYDKANDLATDLSENEQYFGSYVEDNAPMVEFQGFTRAFTAQSNVNIGETYHIKLAIADHRDTIYDSGVYIEGGSFDIGFNLGEDILVPTALLVFFILNSFSTFSELSNAFSISGQIS